MPLLELVACIMVAVLAMYFAPLLHVKLLVGGVKPVIFASMAPEVSLAWALKRY